MLWEVLVTNPDYTVNKNGVPCCPHDPSLPMKPEGNTSHLRCGLKTFKFVCPKMKWETDADGKSHRVCHCENPCTDSKCGRMVYLYPEKDLRRCPGVVQPIRSAHPLSAPLITSKTVSVSETARHRMLKPFMPTFCLPA